MRPQRPKQPPPRRARALPLRSRGWDREGRSWRVVGRTTQGGRLVAYRATTGEEIYRARFSARGTLTGSPVAADGLLYFTTEQGQIYVVEAGESYREVAVHELGEGIMTTPALSDGTFYVRTLDHLWALTAEGAPAEGSQEGQAQR